MFGTRVDDLLVKDEHVVGVKVSDSSNNSSHFTSQKLGYDAVVLAVGHSARDTYQMLLSHGVNLVEKDFAVSSSPHELFTSLYLPSPSFNKNICISVYICIMLYGLACCFIFSITRH